MGSHEDCNTSQSTRRSMPAPKSSVVFGVSPRDSIELSPTPHGSPHGYIALTFGKARKGIRTYAIVLVPHRSHTKRCAGFAGRYGPGWRHTRLWQFWL